MAKYDVTAPPPPMPGVTKTDAAFAPTREALVHVPREQAREMALPWALGLVVLGVIGIPLAGYAAEWRAWLAVVGAAVLLYLVVYAWRYGQRQDIVTEALFKQELQTGQDLNGDGVLGRPRDPIPARKLGNSQPAARGETRRALLMRFVATIYDKGTKYNDLRPVVAGEPNPDRQIREWLVLLASPSWGVLKLVKRGQTDTFERVMPRADALRLVMTAELPPET